MGSIAPLPPLNREHDPEAGEVSPWRVTPSGLVVICLIALVAWFVVQYLVSITPPGGRVAPNNPEAVQGLGAQWDLAKQSNRARAANDEMQRLNARGDTVGVLRVMRVRVIELNQEISRVEGSGEYSMADKQKMLQLLEQERAVYVQGLAAIASIR